MVVAGVVVEVVVVDVVVGRGVGVVDVVVEVIKLLSGILSTFVVLSSLCLMKWNYKLKSQGILFMFATYSKIKKIKYFFRIYLF